MPKTMATQSDLRVRVRGLWNGWQTAEVWIEDLSDIHWHQPPGAPRPLLHAHIWRERIVSGSVPWGNGQGRRSDRLLVCVLKHDVTPEVHRHLSRVADRHGMLFGDDDGQNVYRH
jgi:hypothetical protein